MVKQHLKTGAQYDQNECITFLLLTLGCTPPSFSMNENMHKSTNEPEMDMYNTNEVNIACMPALRSSQSDDDMLFGFVPNERSEYYGVRINAEQVKGHLSVVLFVRFCKDVSHAIPDLSCNQAQDRLHDLCSGSNALRGNVDVERILF